jgi:homoserine kinase
LSLFDPENDQRFFALLRMTESVTIRVPASTSNLGPGFDCLGVALRIYNSVTVYRRSGGQKRHHADAAAGRQEKIVSEAARLLFKHAGKSQFAFGCSATEQVPRCRGLGSSATIRLGILHGLNELTGCSLDKLSIFQLCAQLEGHPDNAAPASFGGFTVAGGKDFQRFNVSPRLKFVLVIPDIEIETRSARKVLPKRMLRAAAIESMRNASAIAAAFASGDYEKLRGSFRDHFHQPFRTKLLPFLPRAIAAAEKTGALGAFLSGSGSTICAVTLSEPEKVGRAMQRAAKTSSQLIITTADNRGVHPKSAPRNP